MDRAETDDAFYEALKLTGPAVVEVQSPMIALSDALEAHPEFESICAQLHPKLRGPQKDPAWLLRWFVPVALDPPKDELMSRSERAAIAERVTNSADVLRECMKELTQANGAHCFPFQPMLSRFAVLRAAEDYLRWKDNADQAADVAEIVHRTRFGIYFSVTAGLSELLFALEDAAQMFVDLEPTVLRPGSQNARRLYFLRFMTRVLHRETGKPCRGIVLSLATMYFDCSDLDEAALSKLAPVNAGIKKRKNAKDSA